MTEDTSQSRARAAPRAFFFILFALGTHNNACARWQVMERTPLITAAEAGHEEIVKCLIEAGACVEAKDKDGETALVCAARNRHEAIVRLLIEAGASTMAKDLLNRPLIKAYPDVLRGASLSPSRSGDRPQLRREGNGAHARGAAKRVHTHEEGESSRGVVRAQLKLLKTWRKRAEIRFRFYWIALFSASTPDLTLSRSRTMTMASASSPDEEFRLEDHERVFRCQSRRRRRPSMFQRSSSLHRQRTADRPLPPAQARALRELRSRRRGAISNGTSSTRYYHADYASRRQALFAPGLSSSKDGGYTAS